MGITSSITVTFSGPALAADIVPVLLTAGWSIDCYGHIQYLPKGDNDAYNWQRSPLDSWALVQDILSEQKTANEISGLGLTWKDSGMGGTFVFYLDNRMDMILSADRVSLEFSELYTDFSWYLERL